VKINLYYPKIPATADPRLRVARAEHIHGMSYEGAFFHVKHIGRSSNSPLLAFISWWGAVTLLLIITSNDDRTSVQRPSLISCPVLFRSVGDFWFREKSDSHSTRSPLTPQRQEFRQQIIAPMSFRHQTITGNINSFNNAISNTVNIIGQDAEQHKIMKWLSPLEPQRRHQGVRTDRLDGVGDWVLETSELKKWRDAENGSVEPVLFCSGNPGVGKTYIR